MVSSAMSRKLTLDDYTVGWICPLEVEQIAALEMLDEAHERLPQAPTDHNVYNLGSIAGHNVVVAGLYQPGNNPAATVVTQMRTTFPNLRFGMLVGIGGGVPVKTDYGMIRLGDVVVSRPTGSNSGALQYHHGKALVGGFERTGALAPPPVVLLNAAQDLQARRARSRVDPLEKNMKKIDTSIPGLQRYKYPGAAHDCLYPSDYIHAKPGASCAECGCDPLQRIQQTIDDSDNEPCIVVHRGTIASGELVVKDAVLRDTLAKEHGVLCFEMEAAGAIADFPCIVIRGISDYCDSHKNDQWHGYAAATAAAYARQLFFHMPIDEVKRYISESAETDIHHVRLQQDDKDRQGILDWLTPVDYGPRQSEYIKMRQPGTSKWLLESAEYQAWLKADQQTLLCPGIPGAGKTILTAVVVNDLTKRFASDPTVGIAYIYCDFRQQGTQKLDDLMASLLKQLAQCQPSLPPSMKYLYDQHKKKRTRPSLDEVSHILRTVATAYKRLLVIIDALDECEVTDGTRTRFLSELFSFQTQHGANIFATSRFIPQIIDQFKGSLSLKIHAHDEDVRQYLHGRIAQSESKCLKTCCEEIVTRITNVIDGMFLLAQLHFDSIKTKTTLSKVKKALKNLPQGSQAYTYAYKDAMERIRAQDADSRELAENVLSWIIHAKRPLFIAELQHALAVEIGEPELDMENFPQVEDMVSVCAGLVTINKYGNGVQLVHYTTQEYFERTWTSWFPNAQTDITKICITYLSLKTFEAPLYREFDHQSFVLYDYAARHWGHHAYTASVEAEAIILNFLRNEAKISGYNQAKMSVASNVPRYEGSQDVPDGVLGIHLAAWFGLKNIILALLKDGHDPDVMGSDHRTPLSYAARNGHEEVVQLLLTGGADIDAKGDGHDHDGINPYFSYWDQTPLMYAARNGHEAVVRLLLSRGADVNAIGGGGYRGSRDSYGQTALRYAVANGHEAVVQRLVSGGANVNVAEGSQSGDAIYFSEYKSRTVLMYAAMKGYETIVRLLLCNSADVKTGEYGSCNGQGCYDDETPSYYGRTALMYAAQYGHDAVVRLLLRNGADINAEEDGSRHVHYGSERPSYYGPTALMYADKHGHEAVVRALLSSGADANVKQRGHDCYGGDGCIRDGGYDFDGRTALIYAASKGHEKIVQLLLEEGAEVNAKEKGHYDSDGGHELDDSEDDNGDDYNDCGRTALTYAAMKGHEAIVKLLLTNDRIEVDIEDSAGRTPLSYAAENGQEAVVKLLLVNDRVEVDTKDPIERTPLSYAAKNGHKAVVKLLLEKGAESILKP